MALRADPLAATGQPQAGRAGLSSSAPMCLLLAQSKGSCRNIEGGGADSKALLASVRRIRAHSAVPLASASPEHISQHARCRPRPRGRNSRDEVICCLLIGAAERTYTVGNRAVADYPEASCQFGRCEWGHAAVPVDMLLPPPSSVDTLVPCEATSALA